MTETRSTAAITSREDEGSRLRSHGEEGSMDPASALTLPARTAWSDVPSTSRDGSSTTACSSYETISNLAPREGPREADLAEAGSIDERKEGLEEAAEGSLLGDRQRWASASQLPVGVRDTSVGREEETAKIQFLASHTSSMSANSRDQVKTANASRFAGNPSLADAFQLFGVTDSSLTPAEDTFASPFPVQPTGSDVIGSPSQDDVHQRPDFSLLPDLVWIKVFQYLPLCQRYHLSQVNWYLNNIFYDGAVWRRATITFNQVLVHGYFYMARFKLSLAEKDKKLARKFGQFFRYVTLRVRGRPEELEDDTRQILNRLQQTWRLEALTLDIGDREWGNRYQGVDTVNLSLLLEVASILRESPSLRSLQVLHWPQCYLVAEEALQLGQILALGEFRKLRSLRLPRTTENGIETVRGPRELSVDCVAKFRFLRHLQVTSSVLSDSLFEALGSSLEERLRTLSIEVCGLWSTGDLNHLMSPLRWSSLTSRCPGLEVSVTMNADVPAFAFARFLVPDIPLVAMTFDISCHCYKKAVQLLEHYSSTLRAFYCFSHAQDCELELLSLVLACPQLRLLTFHGDLSDRHLLQLAEAGGRRWAAFRFLWSRIEKTAQRPTPFNLVAATRRDLDLDLDLTEEEVKAEFCRQVSQRLGYPWRPEVS